MTELNRALAALAALGSQFNAGFWATVTVLFLAIGAKAASGDLEPIGMLSPVQNASVYVFCAGSAATLGAVEVLDIIVPGGDERD